MLRKSISVFLILPLLLLLLIIISLTKGAADISIMQIITALLPWQVSVIDTAPWIKSIIIDVRMPRIFTAALAGACLASCGAVMQGMFRNPLASPSVLGVSSGASLGAVLALYFGLAATSVWVLPLFAFTGASVTLFLVYRIACSRGQMLMGTLLLTGVALGALNSAGSSLVLALSLNQWDIGRMIVYWSMGGLEGRVWDHVLLILPFALLGITSLLMFSKHLDALLLGEIHACSVGVDVIATRRWLMIISACLVSASVSVCGGIGFIGLVVPHILRLLIGPAHSYLLPACAFGGAIALVTADLLLRGLLPEKPVPIGVVTAALGAPFFLFLLVKQCKSGMR